VARPFGINFPERAWVAVSENRENTPAASLFRRQMRRRVKGVNHLAGVVVAAPATAVAGATTTTFLGQALTGLLGPEAAEPT